MPDSIFESVAKNVQTTLAAINTDAGNPFTPLVRRIGNQSDPTSKNTGAPTSTYGPGVAYGVEIEILQPKFTPIEPLQFGKQDFWQHFSLRCFVQQSSSSALSTDTLTNDIYATVVVALMTDAQRAGKAIDTEVGECFAFPDAQGVYQGVEIMMRVHVRTAQFNPYSL